MSSVFTFSYDQPVDDETQCGRHHRHCAAQRKQDLSNAVTKFGLVNIVRRGIQGVGTIPLKSLLCLDNRETAHLSIDCSLCDAVASTPVLGVDGQQTVINLHFYSEYEDKWTIPTLEDTLRACDHDKIVLRPARWAGRSGFEEPLIGRLQRQVSSFVSSLRQPQKQAPSITHDNMERGSPRPGTEKTGFLGRHSSKDESSRHKGSLIEGQTEQKHGNNGRQEDSLEKSGLKR